MTNTLEKLNQVFQDLFDDDELEVNRDTQAEDVEGWDSVMHVSLMIKVEKVFGLKFTSAQVSSLKNVGELVDLIDAKRGH
jgi:acyl carrier protein